MQTFALGVKVHFCLYSVLDEIRTFTGYAVWRAAVHEQPPEQRVAGNVLLGPCHAEPLTPAAVLLAHV